MRLHRHPYRAAEQTAPIPLGARILYRVHIRGANPDGEWNFNNALFGPEFLRLSPGQRPVRLVLLTGVTGDVLQAGNFTSACEAAEVTELR